MAADLVGAVAGHQADNQASHNWDEDHERAEMMVGGRRVLEAPPGIEEKIGEEADQPEQDEGPNGAEQSDGNGGKADGDKANRGGVIQDLPVLIIKNELIEQAAAAAAGGADAFGESGTRRHQRGFLRAGRRATPLGEADLRAPRITARSARTSSGPAERNSAR